MSDAEEEEKGLFFAQLLTWLARADRQREPFSLWSNACNSKIIHWDVLVNPVLKQRVLADFNIDSQESIKGIDLFRIEVEPRSRRQGRAIETIRYLLENAQRAESIRYFAVTEVDNEVMRAGLKKHLPQLIEADGGRFFYFLKKT